MILFEIYLPVVKLYLKEPTLIPIVGNFKSTEREGESLQSIIAHITSTNQYKIIMHSTQ